MTTLQLLEKRSLAAYEKHQETLENLDFANHADWDQLAIDQRDSQLATWARNEFHRLQHQTAKSILAST